VIALFNLQKAKKRWLYYCLTFFMGLGFYSASEFIAVTTGAQTIYQEKLASIVIHLSGEQKVPEALPGGRGITLVIADEKLQEVFNNLKQSGTRDYGIISASQWKERQNQYGWRSSVRFLDFKDLAGDKADFNEPRVILEIKTLSPETEEIREAVDILVKRGYKLVNLDKNQKY